MAGDGANQVGRIRILQIDRIDVVVVTPAEVGQRFPVGGGTATLGLVQPPFEKVVDNRIRC